MTIVYGYPPSNLPSGSTETAILSPIGSNVLPPNSWQPGGGGGGSGGAAEVIPFSTSIPLDGNKLMPRTQIVAATTFSVQAGVEAGAACRIPLIANGVNIPVIAGSSEWNTSSGYSNTNGHWNVLDIWCDGGGVVNHAWSQPLTQPAVITPVAPTWSQAPVVTAATTGSPVTFNTGVAAGTPAPTITYRTTVDNIAVGTPNTPYTPVAGDVGKGLRIIQTATNTAGTLDSTSAAFTVVAAGGGNVAPSWSTAPVVTSATEGSPVTFTSGTASGTPTPTKTFRTTLDGAAVGTPNTPYTPVTGDVGKALRIIETATNIVSAVDSSPSAPFTVIAAGAKPGTELNLTTLVTLTKSGTTDIIYTGGAASGYGNYGRPDALGFTGDFEIMVRNGAASNGAALIGLDTTAYTTHPSALLLQMALSTATSQVRVTSNQTPGSGTPTVVETLGAVGTWYSIRRVGDDLTLRKSTDGGVNWTQIYDVVAASSAKLFPVIMTTTGNVVYDPRYTGVLA